LSLWTARAHELAAAQAQQILELARTTTDPTITFKPTIHVTLGGDPIRLRGIPAIGHGVTGAIRGTRP
jgi:hypothetical protein